MLPKWSLVDIRERMFNRALMVTRERAEIALGVLGPKLNIGSLFVGSESNATAIDQLKARAAIVRADMEEMPGDGNLKKYRYDGATDSVVEREPYENWNGVAILQVRGTLMAENGVDPMSGATGYDGLSFKARHAEANAAVRGAILDIDSGGGECVDLPELCSQLRAFAGVKPLRAIIRGSGCSAAYALAACAGPGQITAAPYSIVGSIGAIMLHADFSKQIEEAGIDVTMITSAPHKSDASPMQPLEAEVQDRLQAMVDACAAEFIDHVSASREVERSSLVAQEARFYSGQEVLDLGLVDKFMPWDESMKEFAQLVNTPTVRTNGGRTAPSGAQSSKGTAMSKESTAPAAETQPEVTEAALQAARAEGHADGLKAGAEAERQRISAVLEVDGGTSLSQAATAAINAGTTAGEFAIDLARANKAKVGAAAAAGKAEAVQDLPEPSASAADPSAPKSPNRGKAYAESKAASVKA